jgi:alkanesulfonate monooxygenase
MATDVHGPVSAQKASAVRVEGLTRADPHLEEAYWFGEGVIPELAVRGLLPRVPASGAPLLGASGR